MNVNNHSNLAEPIDEDPEITKCMMNDTNHSDPDKKPTKQSPKKGQGQVKQLLLLWLSTPALSMRSIHGKDTARKELSHILTETVP